MAWFATINLLASTVVWIIGRQIAARAVELRPASLFALRLAPSVAALGFVATVFLPAHWLFESPGTPESFGLVLLIIAATAIAIAARTLVRAGMVAFHSVALRRSLRGRPLPTRGYRS